jgi:hypothetical protein
VLIAWTLYLVVVDHELELDGKLLKYTIYSYTIPAFISIPPAVLSYYGKVDDAWCWIIEGKHEYISFALRLGCYYIWVWIAIIFTIVIYVKVMKQLRSEGNEYDYTLRVKLSNRLRKYPTVMIVCWTMATVNRLF